MSGDVTRALVADAEGGLTVWDLKGEPASPRRLPGGAMGAAIAWAAEADVIAACGADGQLHVWSVPSVKSMMTAVLPAPASRVGCRGTDGRCSPTCMAGTYARSRRLPARRPHPPRADEAAALKRLPGPRPFAGDGDVLGYDAASRWPAYRTDSGIERTSYYGVMPDGRTPEWLARSGAPRRSSGGSSGTRGTGDARAAGRVPGRQRFRRGLDDQGRLELWPARRGTTRHGSRCDQPVNCVAVSRGGELAAGGRADTGEVHVWDAATGRELCRLPSGGTPARSIAFNGDGTLLAVGTAGDPGLRIWELASGRVTVRAVADVTALTVAPDGWTLAAGTSSGGISLHDLRGPSRPHPTSNQHASAVTHMAFAADAHAIVMANDDGSATNGISSPAGTGNCCRPMLPVRGYHRAVYRRGRHARARSWAPPAPPARGR